MTTVHKYPLRISHPAESQTVSLPQFATILHVGAQPFSGRDGPFIWVLVNTDEPMVDRQFLLVGTNDPIPDDLVCEHVGTAVNPTHGAVAHLFEVIGRKPQPVSLDAGGEAA